MEVPKVPSEGSEVPSKGSEAPKVPTLRFRVKRLESSK